MELKISFSMLYRTSQKDPKIKSYSNLKFPFQNQKTKGKCLSIGPKYHASRILEVYGQSVVSRVGNRQFTMEEG